MADNDRDWSFFRDMGYAAVGMMVGRWIGELITSICQCSRQRRQERERQKAREIAIENRRLIQEYNDKLEAELARREREKQKKAKRKPSNKSK